MLSATRRAAPGPIDRRMAKAHAGSMSDLIFPALASNADLERAIAEIKVWLVGSLVAVAGLAITIAKLI
jgi:hypothetical protein